MYFKMIIQVQDKHRYEKGQKHNYYGHVRHGLTSAWFNDKRTQISKLFNILTDFCFNISASCLCQEVFYIVHYCRTNVLCIYSNNNNDNNNNNDLL